MLYRRSPICFAEWRVREVGADYHVELDDHSYGVPCYNKLPGSYETVTGSPSRRHQSIPLRFRRATMRSGAKFGRRH
jgi:hypothetical protein